MITTTDYLKPRDRYREAIAPILLRLQSIIERRFECTLDYKTLFETRNDRIIENLLTNNSAVNIDGKTLIGIKTHKEVVGYAEVTSGRLLTKIEIEKIQDIVKLVIESSVVSASYLEDIANIENQLHFIETPSNVVKLNQFRKSHELTKIPFEPLFKKKRTSFAVPCMIECQSHYDAFRMALEIHNFSQRFAFVHFDELSEEARGDWKSLSELGPVTLYVSDICQLSEKEQTTLLDLIIGPKTKESPQIIVSSTLGYQRLQQTEQVSRIFLQKISVAYLKMTKPFEDYLKYGVLEFFYDCLTGRSLEDCIL